MDEVVTRGIFHKGVGAEKVLKESGMLVRGTRIGSLVVLGSMIVVGGIGW